ncbi:MAG: DnaQ exonuclease/DinG helicase family protein [Chloroflexi bacterium]|nr:DnaQ exonuclease/DinG helicase family protein [Chloroflexota bacterium]
MTSIVALDIETTGLDSDKDAIIEIGAVRFTGKRVEGEWTKLINPGRRIPPFITQLTGITDQMVLKAPVIQAVTAELRDFVGDSIILGQNIRFDLGFLRKQRILINNDTLDTYEMASVLMPSASRYNLSALVQALGVLLPATHRALDDAQATRGVYLRLMEEAQKLPTSLLAEIVRLSESIEWGGYIPFQEILRSRSRERVSAQAQENVFNGPLFSRVRAKTGPALQPVDEPVPLDVDEVAALLEQGGAFSRFFSEYEYRAQQVEMLRAVSQALSQHRHLLVEAGTGTGKSMAYLTPAALWALQNNCRVVISTNTINLQDQLILKDIPDLCDALRIPLQAAVLKGRGNYLCPRRLESMRRRGPENIDELRVLAKVLVWLQETQTGDRSEINLNGPNERMVWNHLSAEDEGCTSENCIKRFDGACPFHRAHQAAIGAHLLVVNHALLLSDVATGNRVLPDYNYLIIDEAHHMEDATTNALSFHITQHDLDRIQRELGGPTGGLLGWVLSATLGVLAPEDYGGLNYLIQIITDQAVRLEILVRRFFQSIDQFLADQRDGREMGMYSHQERIISATRTQPAWGEVELAWDDIQNVLVPMLDNLARIAQGILEINEALAEADNDLYSSMVNLYRELKAFSDEVQALVFEPAVNRVYWVEVQPNGYRISLHAAPLHIGQLMEQYLWREKASVIMTSATLTTTGEFDYMRGRLNAEDAYELALGSPFDYENAALLYVVNDIPEPSDRHGHQRAVEGGLISLCKATEGRTLVLFTSYDQLKRTSQAITPALAHADIQVYEQGEGASPNTLLDTFKNTDRAVLLGTRAFWEGVDVPGMRLSVLVIVKLPFDVPSDPIIAARSETFDDPFYQYSLPEAILRFRQGFGRLIRTNSDRGVVVVLDRRLLTKKYGRLFVDSLPPCTKKVGSLVNLPDEAARWLNL